MKALCTLLLSSLALTGLPQTNEGAVTYESVMTIDVSRFPESMRSMIPAERKSKNQLLFNEKDAIYKSIKDDEDINREVTAGNGDRVRFKMRGAGGDNEYYTNLEKGTSVDKTEFFGRTFLIDGGEKIEWKVTGEMEMIAGYQCMKATYMRDTIPVTAWFTPQIPVSLGPGRYSGLPGLVLSVDAGRMKITATNIDLRALTEEESIVAPTKGKKVSRKQFQKIQKEKMEEMREMNGGRGGRGGTFIIRN